MQHTKNVPPLAHGRLDSAILTPVNELSNAKLPSIDRGSTKITQSSIEQPERNSLVEHRNSLATISKNVNHAHAERLTFGQKIADRIASTMGSWCFIAVQTAMIATWIVGNMIPGLPHWDNNPFILLNLVVALEAAYAAPIIMMSQNRQSAKDHLAADIDHEINLRNASQLNKILNRLEKLEHKSGAKHISKSS